jgi:membrane protein YdbS with pleckstrin-like domain
VATGLSDRSVKVNAEAISQDRGITVSKSEIRIVFISFLKTAAWWVPFSGIMLYYPNPSGGTHFSGLAIWIVYLIWPLFIIGHIVKIRESRSKLKKDCNEVE